MVPRHVALVPFDCPKGLKTDELLHVAAALQTQLVRDLAPAWGVTATVSPFSDLSTVPVGYYPLAIVAPDENRANTARGFHLSTGGQPLAIVEYGPGWSIVASHELLEMVVDPWGMLTAPGVLDDQLVQYLVEICDPCQFVYYEINGVQVSDFVTPAYYTPADRKAYGADDPKLPEPVPIRCSFTGSVASPFQVLPGGYNTYQTAGGQIFQTIADDDPHPQLPEEGATLSRAWVDAQTIGMGHDIADADFGGPNPPYRLPDVEYGKLLEKDITSALNPAPPPPTRDQILSLIYKLAYDDDYYKQFEGMSDADKIDELRRAGVDTSKVQTPLPNPQPQEDYQKLYQSLSAGNSLGPRFDHPVTGTTLMSLGAFIGR